VHILNLSRYYEAVISQMMSWVERSTAEVFKALWFSLYQYFWNKKWFGLLLYLLYIFFKLWGSYISLQGSSAAIFHVFNRISGIIRKVTFWKVVSVSTSEDLKKMRIWSNEIKVLTDLSNLRCSFKGHVSGTAYLNMNWCKVYTGSKKNVTCL
jgi:hypothetical protein